MDQETHWVLAEDVLDGDIVQNPESGTPVTVIAALVSDVPRWYVLADVHDYGLLAKADGDILGDFQTEVLDLQRGTPVRLMRRFAERID